MNVSFLLCKTNATDQHLVDNISSVVSPCVQGQHQMRVTGLTHCGQRVYQKVQHLSRPTEAGSPTHRQLAKGVRSDHSWRRRHIRFVTMAEARAMQGKAPKCDTHLSPATHTALLIDPYGTPRCRIRTARRYESTKCRNVVILGGGIIGASTAYYLSKLGVASTIIERSSVASAASGELDCSDMAGAHTMRPARRWSV
jgi:FAD dependent oxidoreductase